MMNGILHARTGKIGMANKMPKAYYQLFLQHFCWCSNFIFSVSSSSRTVIKIKAIASIGLVAKVILIIMLP